MIGFIYNYMYIIKLYITFGEGVNLRLGYCLLLYTIIWITLKKKATIKNRS